MKFSPKQNLFLWRLVTLGGSGWNKDIKPSLDASERRPLEEAKLITATNAKNQSTGGRGLKIEVSDAGWAWAFDHMDVEFGKSPAAGDVLRAVLSGFSKPVREHRLCLAEIFSTDVEPANSAEDQIREAYFALTNGRGGKRVRLADLRPKVKASRQEFDATLSAMMRAERVAVFRIDDPRDLSERDREAAYRNPSGDELHLIYLSR